MKIGVIGASGFVGGELLRLLVIIPKWIYQWLHQDKE